MAPRGNTKNRWLATWVLAGGLTVSTLVQALPPEHEIQRLMLAVAEAVEQDHWNEAADYLNRLQQMDGEKPAEYLFYRGTVMARSAHYNEALAALESYVTSTGAEGAFYTASLKLITDIEQVRKGSGHGGQASGGHDSPVAELVPAQPESLASGTSQAALVGDLNRILARAGWRRDPRMIREGSVPDVHYQASVGDGEIQFRESRIERSGVRRLSTRSLSVYGVSPLVEWDCEAMTQSCWVYDPRDGSRFLQLANDPEQAQRFAQGLGRLIRLLQKPVAGS